MNKALVELTPLACPGRLYGEGWHADDARRIGVWYGDATRWR